MKRRLFRDLGKMFHGWYRAGRVKFVYGTQGRDLDEEIKHISQLIEYVKKKKQILSQ
jgi:biotin synthase-like enzyme